MEIEEKKAITSHVPSALPWAERTCKR